MLAPTSRAVKHSLGRTSGIGVMLLCRGSWCPCYVAQPGSFQQARKSLSGDGIKVVARSVGDGATTAELIATHGLTSRSGTAPVARRVRRDWSLRQSRSGDLQSRGSFSTRPGALLSVPTPLGPLGASCQKTSSIVRYLGEHSA